jgi:hypothetical protein
VPVWGFAVLIFGIYPLCFLKVNLLKEVYFFSSMKKFGEQGVDTNKNTYKN